ncbi:MAG: SurA N-terminal domain-containing protein [Saprospiraceae bacterium]|nr:SurA N-terminal domain-containing protein [Pyrinomonadaceae bacterium]
MIDIDNFKGVKATVQILKSRLLPVALVSAFAVVLGACGGGATNTATGVSGVDPNDTAATVNGTAIKMEEVERAVKQQAQGQENKLSPLELAGARLQVLQQLIEQEVMFQKAEKEGSLPTEEEVTAEFNKRKTSSGMSAEKFNEEMSKIGETEASARLLIKKGLAIQKLNDKITGKIEPPKDSEIEAFFNSNKAAFKNKRGAQLGAIVIDPRDLGDGDTTKNDIEAQTKAKEIGNRLVQGADFATVARESSEDQDTKFKGGDWRYFTEEEMKQTFPAGVADVFMSRLQVGQIFPQLIPFEGRYLILKLQRKQETDEERTLETQGVRQEITDFLINSRKQILAASYQATVMNEAKIENYLAKKVVDNPNELSGARPAGAVTPEPAATPVANTNVAVNTNTAGNTNVAANRPAANRPVANTPANTNANR